MAMQFLEREGKLVSYEVFGSGPAVLCVPSMGDLRAEYRWLVPHLTGAGFQVITLDQRGMGDSSPAWADYSVAAVGSDVVALARHLRVAPVVAIGDSSGGGAAVWAAAEAPDVVAGIVLLNAFVRDFPSLKNTLMGLLLRVLLSGPWGPGFWVNYYGSLYPTRPPADLADYQARLRNSLREPGRMAALRGQVQASKRASAERLSRVRVPALVVFGTRDPDFPDPSAEARWIAEQVRGEVQLIADAGHYPHAEMPAETAAVVLPFLRRVLSPRAAATEAKQVVVAPSAG